MNRTERIEAALRRLLEANKEVTESFGDRDRRNTAIARQEVAENYAYDALERHE